MDQVDLDAVVKLGQQTLTDKRYMTALHFMWLYDYFLTFGDEVTYAWHGMRSWIFALFLAIRYTPVLYLLWINYVNLHRSDSFATKWVIEWETVIVTFLAQVAVTTRIYAITGRNKWLAGTLAATVLTQLGLGINIIYTNAKNPVLPLPQINLDPFIMCVSVSLRGPGDAFTILGVVFDLVAFAIIFAWARRTPARFPGIPSLLGTILQGATIYFVVMFTTQLLLVFCIFLAPSWLVPLPGILVTMLIPIMASRLMLSLKKASVKPTGPWTLQSVSSYTVPGWDENACLPSRAVDVSLQIPKTLNKSTDEGDIELESLPKPRIGGE